MDTIILRDSDDVRTFITQGLCLQRLFVGDLSKEAIERAFDWTLEIAAAGDPLPPIGVVSDIGHIVFRLEHQSDQQHLITHSLGFSAADTRSYEDYVLGKLYADWSFERASDAMARYQNRDRDKGLAFIIKQLQERSDFGGVYLSPAQLKSIRKEDGEELLEEGKQSLLLEGMFPLLEDLYQDLIHKIRSVGELLGPEDVFELERGTALEEFGQRVALRQILQASVQLNSMLPHQKVRPLARRQEVATKILDEDMYPVGGFTSLSTRGTIESLVQSQLAYIETDQRPDLFDLKWLRDELLYYSRDENQFLRQRRTMVFALYPDLIAIRFKDAELPYQRIILIVAFVYTTIQKIIEWLSEDALAIEVVCVQEEQFDTPNALANEFSLFRLLLEEQLNNNTVKVHSLPPEELASHCDLLARRSLCHCLTISMNDQNLVTRTALISRMQVNQPLPQLRALEEELFDSRAEISLETWAKQLETLLQLWV